MHTAPQTEETPSFDHICAILNDLHEDHYGDEWLGDFFELNDLGVPMAILFTLDAAEPTDVGLQYVRDSWQALCELLEVSPYVEYADKNDLLQAAGVETAVETNTELDSEIERLLDENS